MKNWSADIQIPTDSSYILRCIEEKFGASSKGSPMITLKHEIVHPATVEVAGEEINIQGVQITSWHVTKSADGDATKDAMFDKQVFGPSGDENRPALYSAYGIDTTGMDKENPTLGFIGKTVYAMVSAKGEFKRKTPTKAMLDQGIREGEVLVNPVTKKPLQSYYPRVDAFYGLAEVPTAGSGPV